MMAGRAGGIDAPTDGGLTELPAELIGTALGHFADTAPIEVADVLAPAVMATGPVPFGPESNGVQYADDPLAALDVADADPALLGIDEVGEQSFDTEDTGHGPVAPSDDTPESFGSGAGVEDSAPDVLDVADVGADDDLGDSVGFRPVDGFVDGTDELVDDPAVGFDSDAAGAGHEDIDPMDDDFDLAD